MNWYILVGLTLASSPVQSLKHSSSVHSSSKDRVGIWSPKPGARVKLAIIFNLQLFITGLWLCQMLMGHVFYESSDISFWANPISAANHFTKYESQCQQTLWVEGHGMFDSKSFILSSCKSFESHHFSHYSQTTIETSYQHLIRWMDNIWGKLI